MKKDKKIGLICAQGGHLVEILQLMEAFEGHPHFFITYDERATLNLEHTYRFANFAKHPFTLIAAVFKLFFIFLKERPGILFSTGAEIAIPPFYIGKLLFRTKLIYLECSAQVYQPSLTGKLVHPITDLFLVQWERLLKRYGPKAKYVGGLIGTCPANPALQSGAKGHNMNENTLPRSSAPQGGEFHMIFVTVGNDFRSFDRLLRKMDEIAPALPHDLVIQRGYSKYRPLHGSHFDFVPMEKAIQYMKESRMVVSHSGIGTIMLCKEHGIPLLIFPRRKRYEEHMNDHQLEIAAALDERRDENIHVVHDENELEKEILEVLKGPARYAPAENAGRQSLIRTLREFIEKI